MLRFDPRRHHERKGRDHRRRQHKQGQNPQRLNLDRNQEDKECDRVPLQAAHQLGPRRSGFGVQALEQAGAEDAVINDRTVKDPLEPRQPVDHAFPAGGPLRIKILHVFEAKHRLRLPVPFLLPEVGLHRESAVMPHHRTGAEANAVACLHQPPAKVDIIPGGAEIRIESPHLFQRPFPVGHVASRDVLCLRVTQQDVRGRAGAGRHRRGDRTAGRRIEVGSSYRHVLRVLERPDEEIEPVGIRHAVRIGIRDHLPGGRLIAHVPGRGETAVRLQDIFNPGKFCHDGLGVILGSVIDKDDLIIRVV